MQENSFIAVFDSGLGGLSVLKELIKTLPHENFLYFGDSKNAPYGDKKLTDIQKLTLEHVDHFVNEGAKAVVIACNTATSATSFLLRDKYNLPIICIEPAIKQASAQHPNQDILVMATQATLNLEKYNRLKNTLGHQAEIISLPCSGLVELIEQGDFESTEINDYLNKKLSPYKKIQAVVLGCTHYPFIKKQIQRHLPQATIYDSSVGVAKELKRQLEEHHLLSRSTKRGEVRLSSSANNLELFQKILK